MLDYDIIETPENVELERRLTGIGTRFIAGLVDSLIIYVTLFFLVLVFLIIAQGVSFEPKIWSITLLLLVFFLVHWGYFAFFEMWTNGQSPGKKQMKIRVVKEGGGAITLTDIAIRNLLRVIDTLPIGYAVAGACMFVTTRTQRLGDLAAGTVVISEQTHDYSAKTDERGSTQWDAEVGPQVLQTTKLRPEECRVLLNYKLRRSELTLESRERVLPKLLEPILKRLGETLPDQSIITLESSVDALLNNEQPVEQVPKQEKPLNNGPP